VINILKNTQKLNTTDKILNSFERDNIAVYATSCKMSVFFAPDMIIGPRVSTSGPTCHVQKNSHFTTCFIQDFF
jgi:hypothetical protein